MKTLQTITIFLLLFVFSEIPAQIFDKGETITKDYYVKDFQILEISGDITVSLVQGDTNLVTITAPDKLHRFVLLDSEEGILNISLKRGFNLKKHNRINLQVAFKDINMLETKIVGDLTGAIKTPTLHFYNSSVGQTDIDFDVHFLDAEIKTVGQINITGQAKIVDMECALVGKMHAENFMVDIFMIENSSVGKVYIHADKSLDIQHNGIGALHYSGAAKLVDKTGIFIGRVVHDRD